MRDEDRDRRDEGAADEGAAREGAREGAEDRYTWWVIVGIAAGVVLLIVLTIFRPLSSIQGPSAQQIAAEVVKQMPAVSKPEIGEPEAKAKEPGAEKPATEEPGIGEKKPAEPGAEEKPIITQAEIDKAFEGLEAELKK